jgi:hypothetical protein
MLTIIFALVLAAAVSYLTAVEAVRRINRAAIINRRLARS